MKIENYVTYLKPNNDSGGYINSLILPDGEDIKLPIAMLLGCDTDTAIINIAHNMAKKLTEKGFKASDFTFDDGEEKGTIKISMKYTEVEI